MSQVISTRRLVAVAFGGEGVIPVDAYLCINVFSLATAADKHCSRMRATRSLLNRVTNGLSLGSIRSKVRGSRVVKLVNRDHLISR
jgi:hypothetical protein